MMIHVYFSLSLSYMTLLRRRGICTMCFRAEKATSSCGSEPKTYLPVPFILIFIPVLWINSETISCWFLWDLLWQTMKKSSNKWLKNRKHYCECVSHSLPLTLYFFRDTNDSVMIYVVFIRSFHSKTCPSFLIDNPLNTEWPYILPSGMVEPIKRRYWMWAAFSACWLWGQRLTRCESKKQTFLWMSDFFFLQN
jgi:hypothetical protein